MIEKTLTVITPTMRTLRLPTVASSISSALVPDGWSLRWLVGYNPPWALPWKEHIRRWDALLRSVGSGYWIIVADDNLLDPRLPQAVAEHVNGSQETVNLILFAGRIPSGEVRTPTPESLAAGANFDGGQAVVSAEWWNSLGLSYDQFGLERFLFKHMYETSPDTTVFDHRPLAMYDGQRNLL